jgi:hypothetical protein
MPEKNPVVQSRNGVATLSLPMPISQWFRVAMCITATILLLAPSLSHAQGRGLSVAVIAPSISTSMEAREVLARLGWSQTNLRNADGILVVVRSMSFNPLSYSYRSIGDLQRDADTLPNISGENFHIYLYQINDDLSVTQLKHSSYKAK